MENITVPAENMEGKPAPEKPPVLSRRQFLQQLGWTAAGALMASREAKAGESSQRREHRRRVYKNINIKETTVTHAESVAQAAALFIGQRIFDAALLQYDMREPVSKEDLKFLVEHVGSDDFTDLIMHKALLMPVLEEAIFRAAPSAILGKSDKTRWDAGVPISAIFALAHNIRSDTEEDSSSKFNFSISSKTIPYNQFVSSLFLWYLMREKGYTHAVAAHSALNAAPIVIARCLAKKLPPDKAVEILQKYIVTKN